MTYIDEQVLSRIRERAHADAASPAAEHLRRQHPEEFGTLEKALDEIYDRPETEAETSPETEADDVNKQLHDLNPDLNPEMRLPFSRDYRRFAQNGRREQRYTDMFDEFCLAVARKAVLVDRDESGEHLTQLVRGFTDFSGIGRAEEREYGISITALGVRNMVEYVSRLSADQQVLAATLREHVEASPDALEEVFGIFLGERIEKPIALDLVIVQDEMYARRDGTKGLITTGIERMLEDGDDEIAPAFVEAVAIEPAQFGSAAAVFKFVLASHGAKGEDFAQMLEQNPHLIPVITENVEVWPPNTRHDFLRFKAESIKNIVSFCEQKASNLMRYVDAPPTDAEIERLWELVNQLRPAGRMDRKFAKVTARGNRENQDKLVESAKPKVRFKVASSDKDLKGLMGGADTEKEETDGPQYDEVVVALNGSTSEEGLLYSTKALQDEIDAYSKERRGARNLEEDLSAACARIPLSLTEGRGKARGIKKTQHAVDINGTFYPILSIKPSDMPGVSTHSKVARDTRILACVAQEDGEEKGRIIVLDIHHKDAQQRTLDKYPTK